VDPLFYFDRYNKTKLLLITTSSDEFMFPDNTHSYWSNLTAVTNRSALIRRLPNAEHSCAGHEISTFFTMRSHFLSVYEVIMKQEKHRILMCKKVRQIQ
jgi:PhoPQ-activated pathogenicity-related protein